MALRREPWRRRSGSSGGVDVTGGVVVVRALVDGGRLVGFTGRRGLWAAQATGGAVAVGDCCLWSTAALWWAAAIALQRGGGLLGLIWA
jgi:hypothetical protein